MAAEVLSATTPDDRVLRATRVVSLVIVPFLLLAWAVLYPWPSDTGRLFAWTIASHLSAMVLGSAYLGGAYFFVRAARATRWHTIKAGFPPVGLFATLMGIATLLHWDKFSHAHVAFWLWVLLYFTTPFLIAWVWWRNRPHDAPAVSRRRAAARDRPRGSSSPSAASRWSPACSCSSSRRRPCRSGRGR